MVFADDTTESLEAAVWLSNSASDPSAFGSFDELKAFWTRFQYSGPVPTPADLAPVRAVRPRLRALFTATRDEAVPLVNTILAERQALPFLTRHDDLDWHIHAMPDDAPLADRILVETAMAMIDVIRADEISRFDRCAADDCDDIVLDLSRNRSRKYCSTTCTNKAAVAAYRARRADS